MREIRREVMRKNAEARMKDLEDAEVASNGGAATGRFPGAKQLVDPNRV